MAAEAGYRRLLIAGALLAAAACGGDDPTGPTPVSVTTASLADGVEGQPYSETLTASGGDSSYSWAISAGSLPTGLALSVGGEISGTPSVVGSSTFSARATSGDGQSATRELTIVIAPVPRLAPADLCSANPGYAIATFEDSVLWGGVRNAVGVGSNDDVTCDQVTALTTLDDGVQDAGVASLVGAQNLTGLTELDLDTNEIVDVASLGGLTSLTELDLDTNEITTLAPLSGLAGLEWLEVQANELTDLAGVNGMASLSYLNAGRQSIADIGALASTSGLTDLDLRENAISDISALASHTGLTDLDLRENAISDISVLSGLTSLDTLDLRDNPGISDVQPLFDNAGLGAGDWMDLRGTAVACARITALRATGMFVGSDCFFLPPDASCGVRSTTRIAAFEDAALESEVRSELNIGPSDDLSCAVVMGIPSLDAANVGIVSLVGIQNLIDATEINLANNSIVDLGSLSGLTSLTSLDLAGNSITDVTALAGLTSLSTLQLENNTGLGDIQALLDNNGLAAGDIVDLTGTAVDCVDVNLLRANGVSVISPCP